MAKTTIFTTAGVRREKLERLGDRGVDVRVVGGDADGRVDLREVLKALGREGVSSVLVEGGAGVITSLFGAGLVDRLVVITAPKVLGKGIEAVGDLGIDDLERAVRLEMKKITRSGDDIVIDARLKNTKKG